MHPAPHTAGHPPPSHPPHSHSPSTHHQPQRHISVAELVRDDDPRPAHWPLPHSQHQHLQTQQPQQQQHQHHLSPPRRTRPPELDARSAWRTPVHKEEGVSAAVLPVPSAGPVVSDPAAASSSAGPVGAPDRDIKRYAKLLTPFIYKLYCLVSDESTNNLCEWASNGTSFIVHDQVVFSADVLPLYFKHNQFSSFVRQLNKYSFHKLAPGACVFGHTHFRQNRPDLLLHIGPPRPQERGIESNRPTAAAGGASLSILQRVQPAAGDADVEVDDRLYRGPPHHLHVESRIQPLEPGPPMVAERYSAYDVLGPRGEAGRGGFGGERAGMDRAAVENLFRSMHRGYALDLNRDFSIAKSERETLVRRLCAAEGRNEELMRGHEELVQRLLAAERRIEHLERGNPEFGIRKRRSEYGDPTGSSKRLRGPNERGGGY